MEKKNIQYVAVSPEWYEKMRAIENDPEYKKMAMELDHYKHVSETKQRSIYRLRDIQDDMEIKIDNLKGELGLTKSTLEDKSKELEVLNIQLKEAVDFKEKYIKIPKGLVRFLNIFYK